MSTGTFLRLPEEKRNRLLDAAWEEFTMVPIDKASVNRMIHRAGIPRGSFYQYFTDKNDLIDFLKQEMRDQVIAILRSLMRESNGDLFNAVMLAFDYFADARNRKSSPLLERWVQLLRVNPGVNLENMFIHAPDTTLRNAYLESVCCDGFRSESDEFALRVGCLAGMCLGRALAETLYDEKRREGSRRELSADLEIIRRGSLRPWEKEEVIQ